MNRHSYASSSGSTGNLSTRWGPGTLTGKALEAFGEATIRGIENLVIRRKLASLRSMFPHSNDTTIGNIEQLYDDILELSRPHLYSKVIERAALRLLTLQIDSGETYHLINGLDRWPEVEIRFFLTQLMSTCVLDVESDDNLTGNEMRRKLSNLTKEALQLVPLIDFIGGLARHNQVAGQAAVEGGFLDMLLRIYVVFPTFYTPDAESRARQSAMLTACKSALEVFSAGTLHADILWNHPVCDLWLRGDQLIPNCAPKTPLESLEDRCFTWRRAGALMVKRRLMMIWSTSAWSGGNREDAEFQACIDMVEFSRQQYYDLEVVNLALLTIFKYIVAGGNAVQHLTTILTRSSSLDTTRIVSEIVQLWLEYQHIRGMYDLPMEQTKLIAFDGDLGQSLLDMSHSVIAVPNPIKKIAETFSGHEKSRLFSKILRKQTSALPRNDTALFSIIHFIVFAAKQSMTIQWGLLDGGALAIILIAFVDGVPILSNLLDAFKRTLNDPSTQDAALSCISLASIRIEASKLLNMIQTPPFQALLQTRIFTKRRRTCLPLLDALLGPGGGVDDVYSELRDVFEEILDI